jgi:hypothetical protein
MIDIEEYKKWAVITDRNGLPADPIGCVYTTAVVTYEGREYDVINCKTHGHGQMLPKSED